MFFNTTTNSPSYPFSPTNFVKLKTYFSFISTVTVRTCGLFSWHLGTRQPSSSSRYEWHSWRFIAFPFASCKYYSLFPVDASKKLQSGSLLRVHDNCKAEGPSSFLQNNSGQPNPTGCVLWHEWRTLSFLVFVLPHRKSLPYHWFFRRSLTN